MKRNKPKEHELSRREREIMDIVYAAEEVSAMDVLESMPDPPGYSSVRKLMSILVEKGHLKTRRAGAKNFYKPTKPRGRAGRSAMRRVLETFYEGSLEKAVAALLGDSNAKPNKEELDRLSELIDERRKEDES